MPTEHRGTARQSGAGAFFPERYLAFPAKNGAYQPVHTKLRSGCCSSNKKERGMIPLHPRGFRQHAQAAEAIASRVTTKGAGGRSSPRF